MFASSKVKLFIRRLGKRGRRTKKHFMCSIIIFLLDLSFRLDQHTNTRLPTSLSKKSSKNFAQKIANNNYNYTILDL